MIAAQYKPFLITGNAGDFRSILSGQEHEDNIFFEAPGKMATSDHESCSQDVGIYK